MKSNLCARIFIDYNNKSACYDVDEIKTNDSSKTSVWKKLKSLTINPENFEDMKRPLVVLELDENLSEMTKKLIKQDLERCISLHFDISNGYDYFEYNVYYFI